MTPINKLAYLKQRLVHLKSQGAVLIISMIFVLVFSALAVSMATLSGTNVQLATNQHKVGCALASAESGLEVTRFWLSRVIIPSSTSSSNYFSTINSSLYNDLATNSISNVYTVSEGSTITIPSVTLGSTQEQSFHAVITPLPTALDPNIIRVDVTGVHGSITRTISVDYVFGPRPDTVFDYGVATKGSLSLSGNAEIEGPNNVAVDSDVYIASESSLSALAMRGNSRIGGSVKIGNPNATADLGSRASIGGETGEGALNNVFIGADQPEFPTPDPGYFEQYVQSVFDPATDTTTDVTLENIRIPADTNPDFSGNTALNGIIYIETPNVVTFSGNTTITGIIVGNGNDADNSGTNQIVFSGNVDSSPVSALPDESQFVGVKDETGTFIVAPGFSLSFGGNFNALALTGAIAGNGIEFFGNAGGSINGSIIDYSSNGTMNVTGNSDIYFNPSGTTEIPAGFLPSIGLQYDPDSYVETM
jgi:hypothetical protein